MSEKALLIEIEKEKQKQVEKKLEEFKKDRKEEKQPKKEKRINVFSSTAFSQNNDDIFTRIEQKKEEPKEEIKQQQEIEIAKETANENVVEKPNFDMLETLSEHEKVKVFKVEKNKNEPSARPKKKKFALIVATIVMAIFGVWTLVNVAQINSVNNQITEVSAEYYNINLPSYMSKLKSLDAASTENMQKLIETIPEAEQTPHTIEKTSNWFDRFCNFLSSLFGR